MEEEGLTYAQLIFHNQSQTSSSKTSLPQERKGQAPTKVKSKEVNSNPLWFLLAFIFFIISLLLLITIIALAITYSRASQRLVHEVLKNSNLTKEQNQMKKTLSLLKNARCMTTGSGSQCTSCQVGWWLYSGSCYYLSNDKLTWDDSRKNCSNSQSDLVVVNNNDEKEFLKKNIHESHWIGLANKEKEGRWQWVDNTSYTTTPKFSSYYKRINRDNKDCVTLITEFDYDNCNETRKWICEKKAQQLPL
ncbi:CD209 antigen-like protein C [Protopterus annectens]|uniref:CD209 antigen-like protein C n=1 Tax=Protopterus annectens TaxID=7888 RepID=UPI001CFC2472|nr:CD209 antigen-like protein C [Protopterus annectens]